MIVEMRHIDLTYQSPDGEIEALRNVNFAVEPGEFIALVGPSGCGKSTLLSIVAGLEKPTAGQVFVDNEEVAGTTAKIGYMPQKDQLFPWRTIWSNVTLGLELQHMDTKLHRNHVRDLLNRYGLGEFIHKTPSQLSGGMRQRCALIRTLATDPKILLLDEPFSALDCQTRLSVSADIYGIIREQGKTAILVTHDIAEAVSLADRVVMLSRRPATVKEIFDLSELSPVEPLARRDHPSFRNYFNAIWKELDIHG